jgi:BolA protein
VRILVISEKFNGLSRLERHRLVYEVLAQELTSELHALALKALTPAEARENAGLYK